VLKKSLHIARILSLDVVAGAVISSLFIADYLSVKIPPLYLLALALAVWLIYTADHLADARKIKHQAHSSRHRFHQQNFRILLLSLVSIALAGLYLLLYLPPMLTLCGVSGIILVGLYFILIRIFPNSSVFPKEFIISLLYTLGIFLAPVYVYAAYPQAPLLLIFGQYLLIALINLLLISWYEREVDLKDGHSSYVLKVGNKKSRITIRVCVILLYLSVVVGFLLSITDRDLLFSELIILMMGATLHTIASKQAHFSVGGRYRSLADAVFCYPLLYIIFF
jgi:uncharacterized membrane protein